MKRILLDSKWNQTGNVNEEVGEQEEEEDDEEKEEEEVLVYESIYPNTITSHYNNTNITNTNTVHTHLPISSTIPSV